VCLRVLVCASVCVRVLACACVCSLRAPAFACARACACVCVERGAQRNAVVPLLVPYSSLVPTGMSITFGFVFVKLSFSDRVIRSSCCCFDHLSFDVEIQIIDFVHRRWFSLSPHPPQHSMRCCSACATSARSAAICPVRSNPVVAHRVMTFCCCFVRLFCSRLVDLISQKKKKKKKKNKRTFSHANDHTVSLRSDDDQMWRRWSRARSTACSSRSLASPMSMLPGLGTATRECDEGNAGTKHKMRVCYDLPEYFVCLQFASVRRRLELLR
jgi:hypothetical protein